MKIFRINEQELTEKILTLLSFASKAKKLVYGKENIREYIKRRKLIIISSDSGRRVKRDVFKRCDIFNCDVLILENVDKEALAKKLGMANLSVIGVDDQGILDGIIKVVERGGASGKIESV
ncbi:MAG: hypothetical protein PWQ20_116 [Thermotogaceae bacterium]|nr:hypothetical protein [Thermotogaceae bacterium]MDN5337046.1 hypothetical protein [Thermotogaceae bacterium]